MPNKTVCAVISASILTIYMPAALPSGYVSPPKAAPMLPNTPQLLWRRWRLHPWSRPCWPLIWVLAYFFRTENIGQCGCLRPFIIANHHLATGPLFSYRHSGFTLIWSLWSLLINVGLWCEFVLEEVLLTHCSVCSEKIFEEWLSE